MAKTYPLFLLITLATLATVASAVMKEPTGDELLGGFNLSELVGGMSGEAEAWHPAAAAALQSGAVNAVAPAWQAFRYRNSRTIGLALGEPIPLTDGTTDRNKVEETASTFARQNAAQFGLSGCELKPDRLRPVKGLAVVLLQPFIQDVPIYGAYLILTLNQRGDLVTIKSLGFGSRTEGEFKLTPSQAIGIGREVVGHHGEEAKVDRYWFPHSTSSGEIILQAAYLVRLYPANPRLRPALFLDGVSGELIAAENRIRYDLLEGEVQGYCPPEYHRQQEELFIFPYEWIQRDGRYNAYGDENGYFVYNVNPQVDPFRLYTELKGRWVDVDYEDGADGAMRIDADLNGAVRIVWTEEEAREDERMLYYHTNFIHSWWKGLDPEFDGLDWQISAVCQVGDEYNNAYWNGEGMYFGGGGGEQARNFAMYADIIYHEYGHGVTDNIYPDELMPYQGEPGSLNEAWSDYFPCSIHNDPFMGEFREGGGGYIRNLDNDLRYDGNVNPEVHSFSRIISGAMWHSREVLGAEMCDDLFHFARYLLGNRYLTYFVDVLETDDDDGDITNGTPHYYTLYEQFGRHAIGPGVVPKLVITDQIIRDDRRDGADGNDDGLYEAGEIVRWDVDLRRDGMLYPPAAENVRIRLTCDHPTVDVIRGEVTVGTMRVGDERDDHPPLLFRISEDAEPDFAHLCLEVIYGDEDDVLIQDSLRITVEVPSLLVVQDGADDGNDVMRWYEQALDSLDVVYAEFATAAPPADLADWMYRFDALIWFTGEAREDILTPANRELLTDFMDIGGDVLLSGQSVDEVEGIDPFLYDYFGTETVSDSLRGRIVAGMLDDPVAQGMELLIIGDHGARNQYRPGTAAAVNGGVEIYRWHRWEGQPAAAVRREDRERGCRTIYLTFGLEAVSGLGRTAKRWEAMYPMLSWLGLELSLPHRQSAAPLHITLSPPCPNPFNSTTRIDFYLPYAGNSTLTIYDVSGREMERPLNGPLEAGGHSFLFDGKQLPAGVYFYSLKTAQGAHIRRMVLLR